MNMTMNMENPKKISFLSWDEFNQIKFPEQKWLIKDLIPFGGIVVIAAPPAEKKSWLALEMARCIASGVNFLAEAKFETKQANVLYIDQETPRAEIWKRSKQLGIGCNSWLVSQDELSLNNPAVIDELYDFIQEKNIGVIFIDTFRSVSGGIHEEKAEEIRGFFQRFKKWKDNSRTVVVLDHCRKPKLFESSAVPKKEQLLGSQDKVAAIEILLMIKSDHLSEEIFIHQLKSKVSFEIKPFRILIRDEGEDNNKKTILTYGGEIEPEKLKVDEAKGLILDYLSEQTDKKSTLEIINILSGSVGKNSVEDALKAMRESGEVKFDRVGSKFMYWLEKNDPQSSFLPP